MIARETLGLLLLAADVWQIIVGIIVFILYGIGQLITAREQANKRPAPRPRPRPPREPAGGRQAAGELAPPRPANQEEALRREVEDFLRRVQGKPPLHEDLPEQLELDPQERADFPPKRQFRAELEPQENPLAVGPHQSAASPRDEGVAEHVSKHLSPQRIREHAEHLGDDVALADERLEARLRHKFDHQLGTLKHDQQLAAPEPREANVAAEIAALLRKPGGMRQLIVAQEILNRPERW